MIFLECFNTKYVQRLLIIFNEFEFIHIYEQDMKNKNLSYNNIFQSFLTQEEMTEEKNNFIISQANSLYHIFISGFLSRLAYNKPYDICFEAGNLLMKKFINSLSKNEFDIRQENFNVKVKSNGFRFFEKIKNDLDKEKRFVLDCINKEKSQQKEYDILLDNNSLGFLTKRYYSKKYDNPTLIDKVNIILKGKRNRTIDNIPKKDKKYFLTVNDKDDLDSKKIKNLLPFINNNVIQKYKKAKTSINSYNDNRLEIFNLTNEKNNLNNNNIKLLQILNENNQKNLELKSYIEENRKKSLLTKAKFLGLLEKLKHRSREINLDPEIFYKKKINYDNIKEIKKENEYLIQKIKMKNSDFQNLYDFIMEIISFSEPYLKECQDNVNELNLYKNNKLKEVENSFNNNISEEITKMKNDYENLKIKYNELVEKLKNEDDKEEPQKQKVKFVVKNISEKTIKEYETKIKGLKDENNKLTNDYKIQVETKKKELAEIKLKILNKDKEYGVLNDKYQKIVDSLKEKLKNEKININDDFNFFEK